MSNMNIFNTQYKSLLTVLTAVLIIVLCVLWFFDRWDERKFQEHLSEIPAGFRGNSGTQQQVEGGRGIF